MPCTICHLKGHTKKSCPSKPIPVDTYTADILRTRFALHKTYVEQTKTILTSTGLPIRLPNMPEDISENIVKFILHYHPGVFKDTSSKWTKSIIEKGQKITGDLVSDKEKTQECKCFTSDGPPSFGPKENWDVIYFLDARLWLEDKFVLWRVPLSNTSKEWKAIKMNKTETADDQNAQGRRPRITWESLKPQIESHCQKIFEGTFDQIFNQPVPVSAPVSAPSSSSASPPKFVFLKDEPELVFE